MAKELNIAEVLSAQLGRVSGSDTGRERIEYLDIDLLEADPENFYQLSRVEELAGNISVVGLQQPIRVRPAEGGRYMIVSGHRRRAALQLLVEGGEEKFRQVPCIVEHPEASAAMQKLRLIYANADTRTMTSAELSQQVKEVEDLLYQLKAEGVEFKGKMRDHVAEICNVKATKLANLKVIREKLIDGYRVLYADGNVSETAALTLARMPVEFQERVLKACREKVTAVYAERVAAKVSSGAYDYNSCMTCPDGSACTHGAAFIRHDMNTYESEQCGGKTCCLECYQSRRDYSPCGNMCSKAKDARRERAAEEAAKNERAAKAQQTRRVKANAVVAQRILRAADAAGLDEKAKLPKRYSYETVSVAELRRLAQGEPPSKSYYSDDDLTPGSSSDLVKLAKQLHCSTDYILGVTESLRFAPAASAPEPEGQLALACWMPGGTTPGDPCDVVAKFDLGNGKHHSMLCRWNGEAFLFKSGGERVNMEPVKWIALPPDKEERV